MFHEQPLEPALILHGKRKSESSIALEYKLHDVAEYLLQQDHLLMKVGLQFPDEMLSDATMVMRLLQEMLESDSRYKALQNAWARCLPTDQATPPTGGSCCSSSAVSGLEILKRIKSTSLVSLDNPHQPRGRTQLCCLCDSTFGSCCPDEITAKHYGVECIIHFGPACMSNASTLPIFYVHPSFHLQRVPSSLKREIEPLIIIDVLKRLKKEVEVVRNEFGIKRNSVHSSNLHAIPAVEIVVVSTHANSEMIHTAENFTKIIEEKKNDLEVRSVYITWSGYNHIGERVGNGPSSNSPAESSRIHPPNSLTVEKKDSGDCCNSFSSWNTNGVCFPMLHFFSNHPEDHTSHIEQKAVSSVSPPEVAYRVQLFFFIGPSNSSQPLHLSGVLHYNHAHYDDLQNELIEVIGESVPLLNIVDETFLSEVDSEVITAALDPAKRTFDVSSLSTSIFMAMPYVHQCVDYVVGVNNETLKKRLESAAALHTAQRNYARRVKQRDYNVEVIRGSSSIGILVVSLSIKGYYETTMRLHKLIRMHKKRSYIIFIGHLNEFKLSNFVDSVDCFVVVACPNSRESHFPQKSDSYMKPVVSPAEVLIALAPTEDDEELYASPAAFSTALQYVLTPLQHAINKKIERDEIAKGNLGMSTNKDRHANEREEKDSDTDWCSSGALISSCSKVSICGAEGGAVSRLFERHYIGLDPRIGETPVQESIAEGKDGVARRYQIEKQ